MAGIEEMRFRYSMTRMPPMLKRCCSSMIIIFGLLCASSICLAKETSSPLHVGISPFTPFVIIKGDKIEGYSIDLWTKIAAELQVDYRFLQSTGVSDKLKNLVEMRTDVAIGGISITEERERKIDFSHPYFHTGLGILVQKRSSLSVAKLLRTFLTKKRLTIIGSFLLFVFIAGNIIWMVERRQDSGKRSFNRRYLPGIFEGMYWAIVTASTVGYGDRVPRSWAGRVLAILLIISFLPFFAYFIAKLSSDITLHELQTTINSPKDLVDKRVGVVAGTTSDDYVSNLNIDAISFDRIDKAYDWLLEDKLDAVVYDRPNLLYFARTKGHLKAEVVGKVFAPQDYGMATHQGSELREQINRAILSLIEKGQMAIIHKKWFGSEP